jgi:hypothetical protein
VLPDACTGVAPCTGSGSSPDTFQSAELPGALGVREQVQPRLDATFSTMFAKHVREAPAVG